VLTFALIHGGGDSGWSWHLVEAELRERGHRTVAPDLPDAAAGLEEYADAVVAAVGDADPVVVVGHSFGALTAPLVAARLPAAELVVLVAGMIPRPGESPDDWWADTGYADAVRIAASEDGGLTGHEDPYVCFYHDVPRGLADEALRRERSGSLGGTDRPWPLSAWPDVETRAIVCTEDRFFPVAFQRRLVADRLGIVPDEIAAGHCVALSRPAELAHLLHGYVV
jgi:pimeloyl-ACP methyl ester carboxylesterase